MRFLIYAPGYREESGGIMVLHYLCHLLNSQGTESFLVPDFGAPDTTLRSPFSSLVKLYERKIRRIYKYSLSDDMHTPVLNKDCFEVAAQGSSIVIYPETTFGNPLGAKNVVRWLLHDPGFHSGYIGFGRGDLQVKYSNWVRAVDYPGSAVLDKPLSIIKLPQDYEKKLRSKPGEIRKGTAYILRKGVERVPSKNVLDGIIVDHMKLREIKHIFGKVENVVSFDTKTFLSRLAALYGCNSIVVPERGVSIDEWDPDGDLRLGVAYGFPDLPRAKATINQLSAQLKLLNERNHEMVNSFLSSASAHFGHDVL